MTKTINKFSILIYNTDNMFVTLFKKIRAKLNVNHVAIDNFIVFVFPTDLEIPGFTGDCKIYKYVGKSKLKVSINDIEAISNFSNKVSIQYISKLIGQEIPSNISYKDLICLINSSENWQKNTI